MQNILQSRPVTKYRLNLVACFFLEPKIHLACSGTLSYAPHHLILLASLRYFMLPLGRKRNGGEKLSCRGDWQIAGSLHESWKSAACSIRLAFHQHASANAKRDESARKSSASPAGPAVLPLRMPGLGGSAAPTGSYIGIKGEVLS